MPLPLFSNGEVLTAAKLNAIVAALNSIEQIYDAPAPLFQATMLDNEVPAVRTWRYVLMHKTINRYLRYRTEWFGVGAGRTFSIVVAGTNFGGSTAEGVHDVAIDLQPLAIPAGTLYTVVVNVNRGDSTRYRMHWLFEMGWA